MPPLNKSELRKKILQQRQSLSSTEWQDKSNAICDRLKSYSLFTEAQTILAYFSYRQEPDLAPLFELNKTWGFPRCVKQSLVWHSWHPGAELKLGKYGISEPLETAPIIEPATADLILVPTVACDFGGYRLGYGGGFYDRLLSKETGVDIPAIGIVFDFAYGVQIATDPWDISLNFVCTETGLHNY